MKTPFLGKLSSTQISQLCTLAGKAYKAAKAREAIEDGVTVDQYRREGQREAANVDSLTKANQGHYLEIRGKWWTVIGNLEQAFYDFLNAGPDEAARKQMAFRLAGQIALWAEAKKEKHLQETGVTLDDAETARQGWAYAKHIAGDKYQGRRIESLNWEELEQLGYTIVNRTSALRGVGDSSTRNKSQRKKSKPSENTFEADFRTSAEPRAAGSPESPLIPQSGSNRL